MKKAFLQVSLPVSIIREGKYFIAYTPALDISTSASSYNDVKRRFSEIVEIFFEETVNKGTFEEVIQDLGWQKVDNHWSPPLVVEHDVEKIKINVG